MPGLKSSSIKPARPLSGQIRGLAAEAALTIAQLCTAHPPMGQNAQADRLGLLLCGGAWTEAALALLPLEAPGWNLRRIEIDDGEWFCALSQHPAMPEAFDEVVEGRGRLLPLAILAAVAEAAERPRIVGGTTDPAMPDSILDATTAWLENVR